jgi:hypothetical protein
MTEPFTIKYRITGPLPDILWLKDIVVSWQKLITDPVGCGRTPGIHYTTESDGLMHPCDAPDLTPQAFLLAVMRDHTIPQGYRLEAAGVLMDHWPEWRPTHNDYLMVKRMKIEEFTIQ